MLVKKESVSIDKFSFYSAMYPAELPRVFAGNNTVVVVGNDQTKYTFNIYEGGKLSSVDIDYSHGLFTGINFIAGGIWLSFEDAVNLFEEDYNIVRLYSDRFEHVHTFHRESYLHEASYYNIFERDGHCCINLIKHNRLHQCIIADDNTVREESVTVRGKWFLCGRYSVCLVQGNIEIYDDSMEFKEGISYEGDIDYVTYAEKGGLLALSVSDGSGEQQALITYQTNIGTVDLVYLEMPLLDLGIAGDRIIANPGLAEYDIGGISVFDKSAWLLYSHIRAKDSSGHGICGQPVPFHRTCGMYSMPEGSVLIFERGKNLSDQCRVILVDYNLRVHQEFFLGAVECGGVADTTKDDSLAMAVLQLKSCVAEESKTADNVIIDIYYWKNGDPDGKIIDIYNYKRD